MNIKKTNIFVTGGAGFIGSHIVDSLVKKGARVTVYDNLSFGNLNNLQRSAKKIRFIKGDILNFRKLKKCTEGMDLVSHQAAQLEVFKATYHPEQDLTENTVGTLNVLRAAEENDVKKIINASSACVYGQPTKIPQDESHPTDPNWAYGVSKLAAEKYCKIFMERTNIPVVSLRYGIVYGPREWYRRVLTIFIKRVLDGLPPVVFDKGEQFRDFIYVDDIVSLHNHALFSTKANGKIYNGGTEKKTTIRELANVVIKASGNKHLEPVFEKVKEGNTSRIISDKRRNLSDLTGMCLANKKAKAELGWKPKIDIVSGIKQQINWYKRNKERWTHIKYTV